MRNGAGACILASILLTSPVALAGHAVVSCGDGTTWDDSCSGGSGGGGGGGGAYVAPAPSGPSPAELAARRQRAEALAFDRQAHAAYDRHDIAAAASLFEQAARLAPNDSNIQGNRWYTRGMVAASHHDLDAAVSNYEKALRYFPGNEAIRSDLANAREERAVRAGNWKEAARGIAPSGELRHYYLGRQAILDRDWDTAIRELKSFQSFISGSIGRLRGAERQSQDALRGFQAAHGPREQLPLFQRSVAAIRKQVSDAEKVSAETDKALKTALVGKARETGTLATGPKLETAKAPDDPDRNPNYPHPPPVYRDASTPRSYPEFKSFTPAQKSAHDENDMGNIWAKTGNWVDAMLSYQRALSADPDGPFASVIKENLELAKSHLGPGKAEPRGAPTPDSTTLVQHSEAPKDVAAPNCTGWMAQSDGSSYRLCTDEKAQRYCEQSKSGTVARVNCQ